MYQDLVCSTFLWHISQILTLYPGIDSKTTKSSAMAKSTWTRSVQSCAPRRAAPRRAWSSRKRTWKRSWDGPVLRDSLDRYMQSFGIGKAARRSDDVPSLRVFFCFIYIPYQACCRLGGSMFYGETNMKTFALGLYLEDLLLCHHSYSQGRKRVFVRSCYDLCVSSWRRSRAMCTSICNFYPYAVHKLLHQKAC